MAGCTVTARGIQYHAGRPPWRDKRPYCHVQWSSMGWRCIQMVSQYSFPHVTPSRVDPGSSVQGTSACHLESHSHIWCHWANLGCLMTPGLSKDILPPPPPPPPHTHTHSILFLNLQITRSDIRPHTKRTVFLVIAYGHFNLPHGFMWVCMG